MSLLSKFVMIFVDLVVVLVCLRFMSDANSIVSPAAVLFLYGRCICTTVF